MKKKKRVLIIRCGLLGDTVDATSVIEPLIDHFQNNVEINWVSRPGISDLFKHDHRINKVYVLKHTNLPFIFNPDKFKIIFDSLFHPYDLILNLEIGKKFNDIVSISRSKVKIGMPYHYIVDDIFKEHRVEHQLRILEKYLKKYDRKKSVPSIIGVDEAMIKKKFPVEKDFVVLCPTNSHFKKDNYRGYRAWPLENWKNLIKKILKETKLNVFLTGNKNEQQYLKSFYPLGDRVFDLSAKTSVPELITIMKLSNCVIATDSGSVHIAGASAKKTISIHGPTNHYQSSPFRTSSNDIKVATLNLPCSPCYDTPEIKKCPKNICMYDLTAEKIFNLLASF
ncbi:MAG: glycosyltransferase family 9 protein [Pseudomonadota bacterium]|nr:glycosyltransferase family 9 protein [Pseudomonadota bacterium]